MEIRAETAGNFCVKSVMMLAALNGRNRIKNVIYPIPLELHGRKIFWVRCLMLSIKRHNDRQPYRHFSSSHGDNEEYHHLPVEIVYKSGHRHESQVCCIQHQLQAHIDHEQVTADQHPKKSQRK